MSSVTSNENVATEADMAAVLAGCIRVAHKQCVEELRLACAGDRSCGLYPLEYLTWEEYSEARERMIEVREARQVIKLLQRQAICKDRVTERTASKASAGQGEEHHKIISKAKIGFAIEDTNSAVEATTEASIGATETIDESFAALMEATDKPLATVIAATDKARSAVTQATATSLAAIAEAANKSIVAIGEAAPPSEAAAAN